MDVLKQRHVDLSPPDLFCSFESYSMNLLLLRSPFTEQVRLFFP